MNQENPYEIISRLESERDMYKNLYENVVNYVEMIMKYDVRKVIVVCNKETQQEFGEKDLLNVLLKYKKIGNA